ncbi:MAG: Rdx family protein [Candidatus Eiseniibacteriota bacterium]|jgi:selenoprotein W-related protein
MTRVLPELKTGIEQYELVPSSGGRFEVFLDDRPIYSKLDTGSFPDPGALIRSVREAMQR